MSVAAVHAPAGVFSRIDVGQSRSSHDPPNRGQRGASKGDAEERRANGRAAGNRGPDAGSQASTEHRDQDVSLIVAINTSSALHARFAEGAQRIREAVVDQLSDSGECRVLLGVSIDNHSQCAVCLGNDLGR